MARYQYRSLQAGRGIAALLVIVDHVAYIIGNSPALWHQENVFRAFRGLAFGVEFFFVLSGIVILMAHFRDIGEPAAARTYVWKRFRRIYPIYWIVLIGVLCLYFSLVRPPEAWITRRSTLLSSFLLIHLIHIGAYDTILGVGWTLFHEVLFYLLFVVAILNRFWGITVLSLWMAGSLVCIPFTVSPWLSSYLLSPLHLLFGYGMIVMLLLQRETIRLPWLWFISGLSGFVGSMVAAIWMDYEATWLTQLAGLSAAVMLLGMMHLERTGKLRISNTLTFLGDASYSIYLVHFHVIETGSRPLYRFASAHHIGIPACMVALFIAGTAVGCGCHVVIERPLLRWMNSFQRSSAEAASTIVLSRNE
jgi:exopolysaccharide production protein ExoZ